MKSIEFKKVPIIFALILLLMSAGLFSFTFVSGTGLSTVAVSDIFAKAEETEAGTVDVYVICGYGKYEVRGDIKEGAYVEFEVVSVEDGYAVFDITVTDGKGDTVVSTRLSENAIWFTAPSFDVYIYVRFVLAEEEKEITAPKKEAVLSKNEKTALAICAGAAGVGGVACGIVAIRKHKKKGAYEESEK